MFHRHRSTVTSIGRSCRSNVIRWACANGRRLTIVGSTHSSRTRCSPSPVMATVRQTSCSPVSISLHGSHSLAKDVSLQPSIGVNVAAYSRYPAYENT